MRYFHENADATNVYEGLHLTKQININELVFVSKKYERSPDEIIIVKENKLCDFWHLYYLEKGTLELKYNDSDIALGKGDVFYIGPEDTYGVKKEMGTQYYKYSFNAHSNVLEFLRGKKFKLPGNLKKFIVNVFSETEKAFVDGEKDSVNSIDKQGVCNIWPLQSEIKTTANPCWQQYIAMCLEWTSLELLRKFGKECGEFVDEKHETKNLAANILMFLKSNVYNRITIEDICKEFAYGRAVISRKFKETYGDTIMGHYNMLKITEARKMINEGIYTFVQISEMLRFSNQKYFIKVFRQYTNLTPTEYKKGYAEIILNAQYENLGKEQAENDQS